MCRALPQLSVRHLGGGVAAAAPEGTAAARRPHQRGGEAADGAREPGAGTPRPETGGRRNVSGL